MPPINHAAMSAGVIAVSVVAAAAIAVYESPELQRMAQDLRRRIAIALVLALSSLLMLLLASCLWDAAFNGGSWMSALGLADDGGESAWMALGGLVKRQSDGTSGSGGNTFVHHKRQ